MLWEVGGSLFASCFMLKVSPSPGCSQFCFAEFLSWLLRCYTCVFFARFVSLYLSHLVLLLVGLCFLLVAYWLTDSSSHFCICFILDYRALAFVPSMAQHRRPGLNSPPASEGQSALFWGQWCPGFGQGRQMVQERGERSRLCQTGKTIMNQRMDSETSPLTFLQYWRTSPGGEEALHTWLLTNPMVSGRFKDSCNEGWSSQQAGDWTSKCVHGSWRVTGSPQQLVRTENSRPHLIDSTAWLFSCSFWLAWFLPLALLSPAWCVKCLLPSLTLLMLAAFVTSVIYMWL